MSWYKQQATHSAVFRAAAAAYQAYIYRINFNKAVGLPSTQRFSNGAAAFRSLDALQSEINARYVDLKLSYAVYGLPESTKVRLAALDMRTVIVHQLTGEVLVFYKVYENA